MPPSELLASKKARFRNEAWRSTSKNMAKDGAY